MRHARRLALARFPLCYGLMDERATMSDDDATPTLRTCAECGQPFMPFPVRESRLCAPCVYRVVTRWADARERRRLLETAMTVGAGGARVLAHELGRALLALPSVRHAAILVHDDDRGRLDAYFPVTARPGGVDDAVARALAGLGDGPHFVAELRRHAPDVARILRRRGWSVVVPLRAGPRFLGAIALGERRNRPLSRVGDAELLAAVAAAAAGGLERARLARELERARTALEHTERLQAVGALATGAAHEISNLLASVRSLFETMPAAVEAADGRLRAVAMRHLRQVLDLADTLGHMAEDPCEDTRVPASRLLAPRGRRPSPRAGVLHAVTGMTRAAHAPGS